MDLGLSEAYLNGAFMTASSVSSWMGPSFSQICLFEPEDSDGQLLSYAKLKPEYFEPYDGDFTRLIRELFGYEDKTDKRITDTLLYVTGTELGEAGAVSVIKADKLNIIERRNSPFPFMFAEQAALVAFKECVMLLVTGNNE